jgi:hypothetical protein
MQFKYKIIERHLDQHSVVIRYYTDNLSESHLCINYDSEGEPILNDDGTFQRCKYDLNIQLWEVPPITGEDLHARIVACAPVAQMELEEKVLNPEIDTSLTEIIPLIGQETEGESD